MRQPKGINWLNTSFVVGTRKDLAPHPLLEPVFTYLCGNCQSDVYTEIAYPADVPLLCNVCAANVASESEGDPDTLLLYDMPADLKARLLDIAQQHRVPVEEVINNFLTWNLAG